MAFEHDTAEVADARPSVSLANDVGMPRKQSCMDFMLFNTGQRPVHVESQRGADIPHRDGWHVLR